MNFFQTFCIRITESNLWTCSDQNVVHCRCVCKRWNYWPFYFFPFLVFVFCLLLLLYSIFAPTCFHLSGLGWDAIILNNIASPTSLSFCSRKLDLQRANTFTLCLSLSLARDTNLRYRILTAEYFQHPAILPTFTLYSLVWFCVSKK